MKLSEIIFLLLISAAVTALCLHAWLVERQSTMVILPPAGIAATLVLLCIIRGWRTLRLEEGAAQSTLQYRYWKELRETVPGLLWCLLALPFILLLGYPLGLAGFAVVFARGHGSGWPASLASGGFAFAATWMLTRALLSAPLDVVPWWLA
ncbi:MAG: hypothetical protein ACM35H_15165 [Bacteroidota bacterium]|nr:hypothetical protein [Kiloniellaceae bacterium]